MAWTNTGGGNHDGADWTVDDGTNVAGVHTNVGKLTIANGSTVTVKAYDGADYGFLEVECLEFDIAGTIDANSEGYGGGGGGGGGGGASSWSTCHGSGASGGAGVAGGANGSGGSSEPCSSYVPGNGGAGGNGGGPYGTSGNGGYRANSTNGDSSTDRDVFMGSGGHGGNGGNGHSADAPCPDNIGAGGGGGGGGAGGRGGGYVKIVAEQYGSFTGTITTQGSRAAGNGTTGQNGGAAGGNAGGDGGPGGSAASSASSAGALGGLQECNVSDRGDSGGSGGGGAGGGVLLACDGPWGFTCPGAIDSRGNYSGSLSATNAGSLKIFNVTGRADTAGATFNTNYNDQGLGAYYHGQDVQWAHSMM